MSTLYPWILLLLVAVAPLGRAETWTNRLDVAPPEALATLSCRWLPSGLPLRLADEQGDRSATFLLEPRRSRLSAATRLDDAFSRSVRGFSFTAPTGSLATIVLRRRGQAWTLFVDDQPALRFSEPWAQAVRIAIPADARPHDGEADDYVQKLGSFRFEDAFLVPEKTPQPLQAWEILAGDWRMHTVTGSLSGAIHRETLRAYPTPARSPNFYSLEGHGTPAAILTGEAFHGHYAWRAAVQHNAGTNGLLFLATERGEAHAFTVCTDPRSGRLRFLLSRGATAGGARRELLAAVSTELLPGNWLLMEARLDDDRVVCLVDHIEIMRLRLPLPPGGRFGLLSEAPEGSRFDDVAAASHEDLALDDADDLAVATRWRVGSLRTAKGALPGVESAPGDLPFPRPWHLLSPASRQPRLWIFGSTSNAPHRLDVALRPSGASWQHALIAGWTAADAPHYRLVCLQADGTRRARLELHVAGSVQLLDEAPLPPPGAADRPLTLTLDASRPGELRGLVDDRLVLLHHPASPPLGAGGLFCSGGRVAFAPPLWRADLPPLTDRFEKNKLYVNDAFMRHWSSPEGQWLADPAGDAWYKSDVPRRVDLRLPALDGCTLHLAVPEEGSNGLYRVAITRDRLTLFGPAATGATSNDLERASFPLAALPLEHPEGGGDQLRFLGAHLADNLLWLDCATGLLARVHLPVRPPGRRLLLRGLPAAMLRQVRVQREPVLDCLFTESLHDWRLNGGIWEVINRFQCDPAWSHMNGENGDGLAALWSKYEISGDFSLEFNAGMRHGWYEHAGDINLTVMNGRDTPGDGYTLTCTGWDANESRRYTRLYRRGEPWQNSEILTVPRIREGSRRGGNEPLVPDGRDVHGAWYTLRLRRVAGVLTALFDNEPLFTCRDVSPLPRGGFGIWTYRNSIMTARVRIAADAIRPRPFSWQALSLPLPPEPPPEPPPAPEPALHVNGQPAEWLDARTWHADDDVSRPLLQFTPREGRPELRVTASQAAGSFFIRASAPPIAARRLLGWQLEVARHPEARFNLEYTLGRDRGKGFEPETPCSLVICGSEDPRGPRRIIGAGAAPPPPTPSPTAKDAAPLRWTPLTLWLPAAPEGEEVLLRLDGFGNLQPSDLQQGLTGNPPGAWFALRNFRPIYSGMPSLEGDAATEPLLAPLRAAWSNAPAGELHLQTLPVALDRRQPTVAWGVTPDNAPCLIARLSDRPPDSIRVSSTLPWPHPLLRAGEVRLDGKPVAARLEAGALIVPLPRPLPDLAQPLKLSVRLRRDREFSQLFGAAAFAAFAQQASNTPPTLLRLNLPDGPLGYQNFESRTLAATDFRRGAGTALPDDDPLQGCFLRFANNGTAARLQGVVARGYDLALWPLLQFRYRGDPMARVSLQVPGCGLIQFAENNPRANPVRLAPPVVLDGAWHTWIGVPADTLRARPLHQGSALRTADLTFGSAAGPDQSGLYSTLDIDDLAAGPAIGPARPLRFETAFADADGVAEVVYAILAGPQPWSERDDAARAATAWQSTSNGAWTAIDQAPLPRGVQHLLIRARDARGAWSEVADVPFLVDREAVQLRAAVQPAPRRFNGTVLNLAFETGDGAHPRLETLKVTCNGAPVDLATDRFGTLSSTPAGFFCEIDWPYLLRKTIQKAKDGDTLKMAFDGLIDAAGNVSAGAQLDIRLDYAADKLPPTILPLATPSNFLWYLPTLDSARDLLHDSRNVTTEPRRVGDFNALIIRATGKEPSIRRRLDTPWDTARHPWLALSLGVDSPVANGAAVELIVRSVRGARGKRRLDPDDFERLPLLPNGPSRDGAIRGDLVWSSNRWNDVLIDVHAWLQRELGTNDPPSLIEWGLLLPDNARQAVQVRAAAILAPWGANTLLPLRGYDASGIAGIVWQGGGNSDKRSLRPAQLKLPAGDDAWLKLSLRDRAGNLSIPMLLPVPPAGTSAPSSLPPAEDDTEE